MCVNACKCTAFLWDTSTFLKRWAFYLSYNMFGTQSPIIASSYSGFNLCQWKGAIEMLIASKLDYLLAVQHHLLYILIGEIPDCKTVHCNISVILQSLFGPSTNSRETGQSWISILFSICQKVVFKYNSRLSVTYKTEKDSYAHCTEIQVTDIHDLHNIMT